MAVQAAIPAVLAALKGMGWLKWLGLGMIGKESILGGLQIGQTGKMARAQMSQEKMLAKARAEAAKIENEENRRATEQYLNMLMETQGRERGERSRDRQKQLVMAMLQGFGQMGQGMVQTYRDVNQPRPPTALTTLLRGM